MYLKEIEINGFKSFADKTNINLDDNITCIVGPNGSGKSNIVDAVRWVLGEQSIKSLRGDGQMADVIFQGSKTRKGLNTASVTLIFDNSDHYLNLDFNTVSVKRRVYKTGENEYFINGEKCRLKDITELFLDTGIGRSSFNIISQGDISKILSSSALERRTVIEEASGILKYKTRREEALRKLDKTNDNLTRVDDIVREIEERLNPLKEQQEKALKYNDLKAKLKEVEVSLLTDEITKINLSYQELKNDIKNLNQDILDINSKINYSEIESLKLDEVEYENNINKLNQELLKLTKEEEEINSQRLMIKERAKYDADDLKVYDNISMLKEKELSINSKINLINKDLEFNNQEFNKKKDLLGNLVNELKEVHQKKDSLDNEFNLKNREFLENKNKISIIRDNLENNNLINSNVKKILNNPRLNGILDAFGNILTIDNKYNKALEVSIASTKNDLISIDVASAKEAIDYLKNNNLGRATFFPMDVIKERNIDSETLDILERDLDYIDTLGNLVNYDSKYRNIVLNQLGNIIVTKDLDSGNHLAKITNNRYRIVTLDGDIIHVGGSITGGSLKDSISPISLKNELSDLIIKNDTLENLINNLNKNINEYNKKIIDLEELILKERANSTNLEEKINSLNKELEINNNDLLNIRNELNNLDSLNNNTLEQEENDLQKEYYAKKEKKELVNKDLINKKNELELLKGKIINLEADNKVLNSELKEKEKLLKDKEIEVNRMDYKLDNNLNILNDEYELTYEKAHEEYLLDMDSNEAHRLVISYKNQIKELGMVNLLSIDEYASVNERYTFLMNQKNDLLYAKDTLLEIIDEMDQVMKEDFKKTFDEVNIEFGKVFKKLFNGGEASLKLTDEDNMLETGVDIYACPPGKTLKTITLLSGGEKTLTAISLIFAILNIRTVPFCLFDEVEAALDESNVDVFGKYLDSYQNKTQFLLITHKKRTMEYAKTLHGITMQESGISKLVSVRLEDKE